MTNKGSNYINIDNNRIINKYEITPLLEADIDLNDYQKDILKDFRPDKATFEYEKPRKNTDSVAKLNTHYYGRRCDKEPFQDDLFLGFTDKDPRSIHTDPLMGNMQKHFWHRKDDYKYSFKDDSDNSVPTAGISESKMQQNKKQTYKGFKDRYKNFDESTDAWTNSYNAIQSEKSRVTNNELDTVVPNLNDVEDIKKRRDYVATLSLESLPVGWNAVPDHKIKIAQYTKLLKQKNLNDFNVRKNNNNQTTDNKLSKILDKEQQLVKQLLLATENFINKKISEYNDKFDSKIKISKEIHMRKINKNKEHMKNNEMKYTDLTDKKIVIHDSLSKLFATNTNLLNIRKTVSDFNSDKKNNEKGNNKEMSNKTIKDKKELLTDILIQSIKSDNQTYLNKGNNKSLNNQTQNIKLKNNNNSKFIYNNADVNKKIINVHDNIYEVHQYSSKLPERHNTYNNDKDNQEKKLQNYNNEKIMHERKPNNQSNDTLNTSDFENDMKFNESGFKDRKTGKMGSKYMFKQKEYESDNEDNVNDSNNIIFRRH
jgi:hypothetical protein